MSLNINQVNLSFYKCWDGSQYSKLLLQASHAALQTEIIKINLLALSNKKWKAVKVFTIRVLLTRNQNLAAPNLKPTVRFLKLFFLSFFISSPSFIFISILNYFYQKDKRAKPGNLVKSDALPPPSSLGVSSVSEHIHTLSLFLLSLSFGFYRVRSTGFSCVTSCILTL
jgi:hypothetical protein